MNFFDFLFLVFAFVVLLSFLFVLMAVVHWMFYCVHSLFKEDVSKRVSKFKKGETVIVDNIFEDVIHSIKYEDIDDKYFYCFYDKNIGYFWCDEDLLTKYPSNA